MPPHSCAVRLRGHRPEARTRRRRCRSRRSCTRPRGPCPARTAGRRRRCWAGCRIGTDRRRRSRSRRRRHRRWTRTACRRAGRAVRAVARADASQPMASMPPPSRAAAVARRCRRVARGAAVARRAAVPPSPASPDRRCHRRRVGAAGTAALVRVRHGGAVVDRVRHAVAVAVGGDVGVEPQRERARAAPAGIVSVSRRRRAPRPRTPRACTRSAPCVAPGWISTVPRWVALSGTSAPLRGNAHVVPQRARVVVDGDPQLVGRRHARRRRTGRASARPVRAACSCRNPLPPASNSTRRANEPR